MQITKDANGLELADDDGRNPRRLTWEDVGAIIAAVTPELEELDPAPPERIKRAIQTAAGA